jgi:hypothetical protein
LAAALQRLASGGVMRILLYLSRLLNRLFGWIAILLGVLIGLGAVSMFILSEATEGRVPAGAPG